MATERRDDTIVIALKSRRVAMRDPHRRAWGPRLRTRKALTDEVARRQASRKLAVFVSFDTDDLTSLAGMAQEQKGNLRLLVLDTRLTAARREFLETVFRTVLAAVTVTHLLPVEELAAVMSSAERDDLFIGGTIDSADKVVVLYRGNLERLAVPFSWFLQRRTADPPAFDDFEVIDHGHTLRFGQFEAATDAVLYDLDAEYRRAAKKREIALDTSFGASLRRLRLLRGLSRDAFAPVSSKAIARIERGEIGRPRKQTVEAIADRLGVTAAAILSY